MVNKNFISNDSTIACGTQQRSNTITLNFRIFVPQVEFQTLIRSFQNRCREVIRARGGHTRY
jgi:hypothetical protein